jgi:nitroreductase
MRDFLYDISEDIQKRWSPRAYSEENVPESEVMALLEAARYAPSCFNEQPWRFIVAMAQDELELMRGLLTETNQSWANKAPVLAAIIAKKQFGSGKDNYWHMFDSGTAWGFFALEAQRRGLIAHAMGGYNREKAQVMLGVPEEYSVITIVAVGKYGDKSQLPAALQSREQPNIRKPLSEIVSRGRFRV